MLDHRVYRAAFLPALVALFVLAFSLTDVPKPQTTRLAPLAFDASRAFSTMQELAQRFPDRRPGSSGDAGVADRVAQGFRDTGFATAVARRTIRATTIDGRVDLENVLATREGLSNHTIVVIAHRDARGSPALAELSGTATLLELARLFADRDLEKTVVLASVSGGTGGFAGARAVTDEVKGPIDAVVVLGDLAGRDVRRPFVIPWSNASGPLPLSLERTAQSALRTEVSADPGRTRAAVQLLRRALPLSTSEQGVIDAPAVLISASSERGPRAGAPVDSGRLTGFGRAVLRTLYAALETKARDSFPAADGIVALKRLVPGWSIRLLVLAFLLPPLLTAFDGFFRARRRGAHMGTWALWTLAFALPVLAAWVFARLLGAIGAVTALPAPGLAGRDAAGWAAVGGALLVGAGVAYLARPRQKGPALAAGGAAAASGLMLSALTLLVWLFNPYAAAVLLPAAHAWLLATAPGPRLSRVLVLASVAAGLALPLLVVAYYMDAFGLGPLEVVWMTFGLVAGGVLGLGAMLTVALFCAALAATVSILRVRRALADTSSVEDDRLVTRGPRSYAGPGSLGGTESALRR